MVPLFVQMVFEMYHRRIPLVEALQLGPLSIEMVARVHYAAFIVALMVLSTVWDSSPSFVGNHKLAVIFRSNVSTFVLGLMCATVVLRRDFRLCGKQQERTVHNAVTRSFVLSGTVLLIHNISIVAGLTEVVAGLGGTPLCPASIVAQLCLRSMSLDAAAVRASLSGRERLLWHLCNWAHAVGWLAALECTPSSGGQYACEVVSVVAGLLLVWVLGRMTARVPESQRCRAVIFSGLMAAAILTHSFLLSSFGGRLGESAIEVLGNVCDVVIVGALGVVVTGLHWGTEREVKRMLVETQEAFDKHRKFMSYICHELRVPLQSIGLAAEEAYEALPLPAFESSPGVSYQNLPLGSLRQAAAARVNCDGSASTLLTAVSGDTAAEGSRANLRIILTATAAMGKLLDDTLHLSKIE